MYRHREEEEIFCNHREHITGIAYNPNLYQYFLIYEECDSLYTFYKDVENGYYTFFLYHFHECEIR